MLYQRGDLIANATTGILLHGCNSRGVMASGVAKSVREAYPEVYAQYMEDYVNCKLTLGFLSVVDFGELTIISAITQENYGRDPNVVYVNYDAISTVFSNVWEQYPGVRCNIPKIGSGLGNGDWDRIEKLIDHAHPAVTCWIP